MFTRPCLCSRIACRKAFSTRSIALRVVDNQWSSGVTVVGVSLGSKPRSWTLSLHQSTLSYLSEDRAMSTSIEVGQKPRGIIKARSHFNRDRVIILKGQNSITITPSSPLRHCRMHPPKEEIHNNQKLGDRSFLKTENQSFHVWFLEHREHHTVITTSC